MKKIICFIAFVMAMFMSACTSTEQQKEMCNTYNDACYTIAKRLDRSFFYRVKTVDVQCKGWTEKQEVYIAIPSTIYGYGKNVHDVRFNVIKAFPSYYTEDGHYCYITAEEYRDLPPTVQRLYIELYQPYK